MLSAANQLILPPSMIQFLKIAKQMCFDFSMRNWKVHQNSHIKGFEETSPAEKLKMFDNEIPPVPKICV